MIVSSDASQHTGHARGNVIQVPGYHDDTSDVERWLSGLDKPRTRVLRTMCYDIRTTQTLRREVDRLRHDQRAVYNRDIGVPQIERS